MHHIRLVGPWEFQSASPSTDRVRVTLPCAWSDLPGPPTGAIRLARSFHSPTGLVAGDRVVVICPFIVTSATIDDQDLPVEVANDASRFDVTSYLSGFHRLELCLGSPASTELAVVLEIRPGSDG